MTTRQVSNVGRVITVLHDAGKPLLSTAIARKTGLSVHVTSQTMSNLHARQIVQRAKLPNSGSRFYWWSLVPGRYEMWLTRCHLGHVQRIAPDVAGVPQKLKFLRRLTELPAFEDNAMLGLIVKDYANALSMAHLAEEA
jgi:DNA-binding transcriptional regulator GbsR (MarR family)